AWFIPARNGCSATRVAIDSGSVRLPFFAGILVCVFINLFFSFLQGSLTSNARGMSFPHENSNGVRRCWHAGRGKRLPVPPFSFGTWWVTVPLLGGDFAFMLLN